MSRLGTLLRGMRLARRWDVDAMAGALQTSPRRLQLVEAGVAFPSAAERRSWAVLLGFADLLDFDQQWRDGWGRVVLAHREGWIPVINRTPAGHPTDYEEYGIDSGIGFEYVPRSPALAESPEDILFAVVVIGNSMWPAWQEGDLAIFRPVDPFEKLPDGSPVFVRFTAERNNTCTFKNLWAGVDGLIELRPENAAYPSLNVPAIHIDRMALAVERRAGFWIPKARRQVRDQYTQEFPEE